MAPVASNIPRGCCDIFWNLLKHWKQPNKKIEKIAPSRKVKKSQGPDWSSRSSFLPSFIHPAYDIKFADTRDQLESLFVKSMTQRNLKHKAPSVRALFLITGVGALNFSGP